jgi:hypothetical protein
MACDRRDGVTVLEALAILEAATVECKKRDIDTPAVKQALNLLQPYIRPTWMIPQFRHEVLSENIGSPGGREGQQQVLRVTFDGIRDAVRGLLEVRMDSLAQKFHETRDMKVKDEILRLAKEYETLQKAWVFVAS